MKTAMEIQAERLRETLTEACCDGCGAMSKKLGKKVCCGDKAEDKNAKDKTSDTSVGPEFDGGQDVVVRVSEQKEKPTTHPFIKRCVAAITQKNGEIDRDRVSRAFAICTAQMKKSPKAAKAKKKEGVPADRMSDYESALKQAREKQEEQDLTEKNLLTTIVDGVRGWWRTINGSHVFISKATGKPHFGSKKLLTALAKEPEKKEPEKAKEPEKKAEPKEPKEPKEPEKKTGDLKSIGDSIRNTSKINAGTTSLEDLMKYAAEKFAEAGTTPEEALPGFEKNLKALKEKMSFAKDVKRIDMPVIEPKDMEKFKKDLESGAVDVFPPYAKETLKKYKTPFPWERTKTPAKAVAPGSEEAKKLIGLGLPKHDKGPKGDDIVKGEFGSTATKDLKPLQNEIWMSKVLGNIMSFGAPEQGGKLTDDAPIIVSKDGYILDGHHRFGQAMLANPDLKLKSLSIPLDLDTLLKVGRTYGTAIGNEAKP